MILPLAAPLLVEVERHIAMQRQHGPTDVLAHEVTIRLAAPNADLPVILGTWSFLILRDGVSDVNAHMNRV